MKLTLKTPKPRNPFALAARRRSAGAHADNRRCLRSELRREQRLEIERLRPSP